MGIFFCFSPMGIMLQWVREEPQSTKKYTTLSGVSSASAHWKGILEYYVSTIDNNILYEHSSMAD